MTTTIITDPCPRCEGCGKLANSDDQEPWTFWENLPVKSAAAVIMGLVKPVPCYACQGSGNATATLPVLLRKAVINQGQTRVHHTLIAVLDTHPLERHGQRDVCGSCRDTGEEPVDYPCETIRVIAAGLQIERAVLPVELTGAKAEPA